MRVNLVDRLREQRRSYESTPHDWPEEKEEVVDPSLWTEAAETLDRVQQALIERYNEAVDNHERSGVVDDWAALIKLARVEDEEESTMVTCECGAEVDSSIFGECHACSRVVVA